MAMSATTSRRRRDVGGVDLSGELRKVLRCGLGVMDAGAFAATAHPAYGATATYTRATATAGAALAGAAPATALAAGASGFFPYVRARGGTRLVSTGSYVIRAASAAASYVAIVALRKFSSSRSGNSGL